MKLTYLGKISAAVFILSSSLNVHFAMAQDMAIQGAKISQNYCMSTGNNLKYCSCIAKSVYDGLIRMSVKEQNDLVEDADDNVGGMELGPGLNSLYSFAKGSCFFSKF